MVGDDRWFLRDRKPYDLPVSLDMLHGPSFGMVELPKSIYWAPGSRVMDLDTHAGLFRTYVSALSEGTTDEICALVNAERLRASWRTLVLPRRVEALWENRFPELAGK